MAEIENSKLKTKVILTVLETDVQELATQIGEPRAVVSDIINGKPRKAIKARRKLADTLCQKMTSLILPAEQTEAEKAV